MDSMSLAMMYTLERAEVSGGACGMYSRRRCCCRSYPVRFVCVCAVCALCVWCCVSVWVVFVCVVCSRVSVLLEARTGVTAATVRDGAIEIGVPESVGLDF